MIEFLIIYGSKKETGGKNKRRLSELELLGCTTTITDIEVRLTHVLKCHYHPYCESSVLTYCLAYK